MQFMKCATCAYVVFIFSFTGNSVAAIELVSDDRRVTTFSDSGGTTTTPDSPFSDFSVNYQNTTVSNSQFAGSGSGYGESDFSFFIAESFFDITFEVTSSTELNLSGDYGGTPGDFGFAEVEVLLTALDVTGNTLIYADSIQADDIGGVDDTFDYQGTLSPGEYQLVLQTNITPGGFDTTAYFSFSASFDTAEPDVDGDGVADSSDNCTLIANADQNDSDTDGFGNECDQDLNNDNIVNFLDVGAFVALFGGTEGGVGDFNGDNAVNFLDYAYFPSRMFQPPGPSGVAP